jgi:hypothetical protein
VSAKCLPSVCQVSAKCLPSVCQVSAKYLPSVCQVSSSAGRVADRTRPDGWQRPSHLSCHRGQQRLNSHSACFRGPAPRPGGLPPGPTAFELPLRLLQLHSGHSGHSCHSCQSCQLCQLCQLCHSCHSCHSCQSCPAPAGCSSQYRVALLQKHCVLRCFPRGPDQRHRKT